MRARKPFVLVAGLLGAALVSVVVTGPGAAEPAPTTATLSAVIVQVAPGADPATVAAAAGVTPDLTYDAVVLGFSARVTTAQRATLARNRKVVAIVADTVAGRIEPTSVQVEGSTKPGTPPQPAQQVKAAARRVGVLNSPTARVDGVDQQVNAGIAVVDSGVDPGHPDLNVKGGVNCVADTAGWGDHDGHGTMVAGYAAARDNAIGVVGIAPGARIWSVRVAGDDPDAEITDSALLCGLDWILKHRTSIDVANLSLSDTEHIIGPCPAGPKDPLPPPGDLLHAAICAVTRAGVTVVVAAGNHSRDASTVAPAAYDEVITVSAFSDYDGLPGGLAPVPSVCFPTEYDDTFASFSDFGAPVDISAPGVCVTSTYPGGLYAFGEGTSFSTPFVAGAAALIKAVDRKASPAKVRQRILDNAFPGPIVGDPDVYPEGILNVSGF